MQQWLTQQTLTVRLNRASRWQEHQRLVFEAIHNSDTSLLKSLLRAYRESLQNRSTLLLRWGFANCTCEIYNHNITSEDIYQLKRGDYLEEQEVVKENKQLTREAPALILGYLGLARAYSLAFIDPDLNQYYKIIKEESKTIKINGKEQKIIVSEGINPERIRRYRELCNKILRMDPENPFVHYWNAVDLIFEYARDVNLPL